MAGGLRSPGKSCHKEGEEGRVHVKNNFHHLTQKPLWLAARNVKRLIAAIKIDFFFHVHQNKRIFTCYERLDYSLVFFFLSTLPVGNWRTGWQPRQPETEKRPKWENLNSRFWSWSKRCWKLISGSSTPLSTENCCHGFTKLTFFFSSRIRNFTLKTGSCVKRLVVYWLKTRSWDRGCVWTPWTRRRRCDPC